MSTDELLIKVKKALGITGSYQDETLKEYIEEVLAYLRDSGVPQAVVNSTLVAGVVTRGVADLWNYGSGNAQLSAYFYQRASQLVYKVIENDPFDEFTKKVIDFYNERRSSQDIALEYNASLDDIVVSLKSLPKGVDTSVVKEYLDFINDLVDIINQYFGEIKPEFEIESPNIPAETYVTKDKLVIGLFEMKSAYENLYFGGNQNGNT